MGINDFLMQSGILMFKLGVRFFAVILPSNIELKPGVLT